MFQAVIYKVGRVEAYLIPHRVTYQAQPMAFNHTDVCCCSPVAFNEADDAHFDA
jgi:hypothetical protein